MNKKLIVIGVLGLAGFGYYFYNKKKKDTPVLADTSVDETNVSIKSTTSIPQNVKPDWNKILKKGSKGIEVRTLQKALKKVDVDGDFGIGTEKRLKQVTGLTEISVNQYNQSIDRLQSNKAKQLKEAQRIKAEQKLKEAKKVVAQAPPKTSFTDGLIKPLGT
jgi:phage antirepressor YoqD-like protein